MGEILSVVVRQSVVAVGAEGQREIRKDKIGHYQGHGGRWVRWARGKESSTSYIIIHRHIT